MSYLIAYKQGENTYVYVKSIGEKVETTMFYGNALNFLTQKYAKNISGFLNDYDKEHNYVVIKYEYNLEEE